MDFSVEKQILKLIGATVRTYTTNRQVVCKAEQKAFKLKEHIVFYADEAKTQHMFSIKARNLIDIGATYDIFAPDGVSIIASLRRKGLKSAFVQDEWQILDAAGNEIGQIQEEGSALAILRRYIEWVSLFSPQRYNVFLSGQQVGWLQQNYNPFTMKLACHFTPEGANALGQALVYAIPNMLAVLEGKQN